METKLINRINFQLEIVLEIKVLTKQNLMIQNQIKEKSKVHYQIKLLDFSKTFVYLRNNKEALVKKNQKRRELNNINYHKDITK